MGNPKVKLRMGMHNRVTAERYKLIKAALAMHVSEEKIMSDYDIKESTLRKIKRTKTYYEYHIAEEKLPRLGKMPTVMCSVVNVPYEDFGHKKIYRKPLAPSNDEGKRPHYEIDSTAKMVGIVMGGCVIIVVSIVVAVAVAFLSGRFL